MKRILGSASLLMVSCIGICTAPATPPSDCVKEGDPGNELHIGEFCTPGGGQCFDNSFGEAIICTVDHVADADLWMCTMTCDTDADCGSNAVCQGDPSDPESDKGCVPAKCATKKPDPVDAGPPDAGESDAGPVDAGETDGGPDDAGAADAR